MLPRFFCILARSVHDLRVGACRQLSKHKPTSRQGIDGPVPTSAPKSQKTPAKAQPSAPVTTHRTRQHKLIGLVLIAAVAIAARGVYLWQLHGTLPFAVLILDARAYDDWARRIAAGDWLGTEVFYQAPLYPYFLATLNAALGHDLLWVRVVQSALGVVSCLLLAWAGRRFFTPRAGLIAGLLLALYPPAIFFDALVQKASLDLLLMTSLLALLAEAIARRRWPWLLGVGIALGALTLNRENAGVLLPILAGWLCWEFRDAPWRNRAGNIATVVLGTALILLPVGYRNYRVGGEFLLTTAQLGPNFYIGNHAGANGQYQPLLANRGDPRFERVDATRLAQDASGRELSPREVSTFWLARALQFIRQQPGDWLRLMGWKLLLVIHATELVDGEGIELYASYSGVLRVLFSVLNFGTILPLAVFGLWATARDWRKLSVLYMIAIGLAGSTALFYVFARYRFSGVPVAVLFASAGIDGIAQFAANWRNKALWRQRGPGLLLAGIAAIVCNYPLPVEDQRAIAYTNLGMGLLNEDRPADAIAPLHKAIEIRPQLAGAHHNLGRAFTLLHRDDDAVAEYEKALELDPDLGLSHAALGEFYFSKGQLDKAYTHLSRAASLSPEVPLIHAELAEILVNRGEPAAAVGQLRAGLKINPESWLCGNNLAWILATCADPAVRNGGEALAIAEDLARRELAPDQSKLDPIHEVGILDTLGAARAATGQFDEAAAAVRQAIAKLKGGQASELVAELKSRLALYEQHQPYRLTPPARVPQ